MCHPRGCAAVSNSHSDQLLTTFHPNTTIPACFAAFAVRSVSPKFHIPCSNFFQRHFLVHLVALKRWFSSGTQSLHNFCHNFMLKCCSFQMSSYGWSTKAEQDAHEEGCWLCICFGHVQQSMALQPLSTAKASCASVAQGQVPAPSSWLHYPSSSHNPKCTATSRSENASSIR